MNNNYLYMWLKKHVEKNDYPPFHLINSVGWLFILLADTFIVSPQLLLNNSSLLITNTLQWLSGYFISIYIRSIYIKYNYSSQNLYKVFLFVFTISFLASILLFFAVHFIAVFNYLDNLPKFVEYIFSIKAIANNLTRFLPLLTTWSLLYFGIKFWIDLQTTKSKIAKADLLAQSAQLQMLRYQINPHFLFNSFSSLRALIRTDKDKAEEMLNKLSDFYRYTLLTKNSLFVPLQEEIDALKHYASIEKIRFEEKIEFTFSIPEAIADFQIPTFVMNPLIENAIKYGMASSSLPLKIIVEAETDGRCITLRVKNSGKWIDEDNQKYSHSTGTGLKNIVERLEHIYGNNYEFITKEDNEYVIIELKIEKDKNVKTI